MVEFGSSAEVPVLNEEAESVLICPQFKANHPKRFFDVRQPDTILSSEHEQQFQYSTRHIHSWKSSLIQ